MLDYEEKEYVKTLYKLDDSFKYMNFTVNDDASINIDGDFYIYDYNNSFKINSITGELNLNIQSYQFGLEVITTLYKLNYLYKISFLPEVLQNFVADFMNYNFRNSLSYIKLRGEISNNLIISFKNLYTIFQFNPNMVVEISDINGIVVLDSYNNYQSFMESSYVMDNLRYHNHESTLLNKSNVENIIRNIQDLPEEYILAVFDYLKLEYYLSPIDYQHLPIEINNKYNPETIKRNNEIIQSVF